MKRSDFATLLSASAGRDDNAILRAFARYLEPARGAGWISFTDTVFTSSAPLFCPGGVRTPVSFTYDAPDAGGAYAGDMTGEVLREDRFHGLREGDAYLIRYGLTMRTAVDMQGPIRGVLSGTLSGNRVAEVAERQNDVRMGIDFGVFDASDYRTAPRKVGVNRDFTMLFLVQVRGAASPIITTGGQFYVEPEEDTEVFDLDVSIQRLYGVEGMA